MIELTTPVGRIVWGNPAKAKGKVNKETKQPVIGKDGQQVQEWSFGLAIPKDQFNVAVWPAMQQEAATAYPNGVPQKFSWKLQDGDGIDGEGKPFNTREGYAGCWVLAISTVAFAPPIYKFNPGQGYVQLPPEGIKCGDYVAVGLNLKVNVPTDRTHTPGLYVNPTAIEFVGYGQEIVSQGSVDPNAVFGGQQRALPPGASATPVGAPAGAPGMPGQQAPMQMPGNPAMGMPAQQQMPAPAHDFVQNAGQQPMQAPMQQPGMMPGMPAGMPGMPGPR